MRAPPSRPGLRHGGWKGPRRSLSPNGLPQVTPRADGCLSVSCDRELTTLQGPPHLDLCLSQCPLAPWRPLLKPQRLSSARVPQRPAPTSASVPQTALAGPGLRKPEC